jgi:hypothetical protein
MVFIFFACCTGDGPSTWKLIWLMTISLAAFVLISIGSGSFSRNEACCSREEFHLQARPDLTVLDDRQTSGRYIDPALSV